VRESRVVSAPRAAVAMASALLYSILLHWTNFMVSVSRRPEIQ
jgi:hypothetical protein